MLNRQTHHFFRDPLPLKPTQSIRDRDYQHGLVLISILLDLPSESLTHITSYLDPPSLLALAKVNQLLYQHVKDDNTWHRAFVYQHLGIAPESDLHDAKSLMMRRSERSWRSEFIVRYNLRRRWERSRNATVAHIPLHSPISSLHLMPSHSLLSSSLQYGIVSRSIPLTGKILRGYLDASGAGAGLGVGNPNAEFTPDVSACTLASDGGTAKILWGYRNGGVAVMTANKAMDAGGRATAKLVKCKVDEEHEGAVLDAVWGDGNVAGGAVSGGADGRVKIWDVTKVKCVWTSERKAGVLVPDPCVKVVAGLSKGFIVGAMRSGEIVVWAGFDSESPFSDAPSIPSVKALYIPSPIHDTDNSSAPQEVTALHVDPTASIPTFLATYQDHSHFYRFRFNAATNSIEQTPFGDASFGPISTLQPFFSDQSGESSFIIAGDHLGCISIYDWGTPKLSSSSVSPIRKFEAQEDGSSITALTWNGVTLITGSARGTVHVWDALTFEHLRSFSSPVPRPRGGLPGGAGANAEEAREKNSVRQILVGPEREVLIAGVGDRVMAWRAGPIGKSGGGGVRGRKGAAVTGKKKKERGAVAKYHQQVELHQTITESRHLLEQESEYVQRAYGREREQRARLERLGLDEVEAVEYVLMVSRDEEEMRRSVGVVAGGSTGDSGMLMEDAMFGGDFDDIPNPNPRPTIGMQSSPSSSPPSSSSSSSSINSGVYHNQGRLTSRSTPSSSINKIQLSPRLRAEPIEAGPGPMTGSSSIPIQAPLPVDQSHFPPISPSSSPNSRGNTAQETSVPRLVSESPPSPTRTKSRSTSAWSTPLVRSAVSSPGSSVPRGNVWPNSSGVWLAGSSSRSGNASGPNGDEEMDADLRYAIELSLVEARSRDEV